MKHSVITCGSKCNFNCYSSTFTILSTLFSLNSFVVTTICIFIYHNVEGDAIESPVDSVNRYEVLYALN